MNLFGPETEIHGRRGRAVGQVPINRSNKAQFYAQQILRVESKNKENLRRNVLAQGKAENEAAGREKAENECPKEESSKGGAAGRKKAAEECSGKKEKPRIKARG